jgi:hypothetical protein
MAISLCVVTASLALSKQANESSQQTGVENPKLTIDQQKRQQA